MLLEHVVHLLATLGKMIIFKRSTVELPGLEISSTLNVW